MLTHSNVGTMINVFNWRVQTKKVFALVNTPATCRYMLEHFYPTLMKNYNPQIEAQVLFMPCKLSGQFATYKTKLIWILKRQ